MAIDIIKGSDKDLIIRLEVIQAGQTIPSDPFDLSGIDTIRACFQNADGSSLIKALIDRTGDVASGSTVVTVVTTDIEEGMAVSGSGIPANTVVTKTPLSTASPSADGTVVISNAATLTATEELTFGDIDIEGNPLLGKIRIPLHESETDLLQDGVVDFEVKLVKDDVTSYVQFPSSLNVIDRFC